MRYKGKYPKSVTAKVLRAVVPNKNFPCLTLLHHACSSGLPKNTTVEDLITPIDNITIGTALHEAAKMGTYPPGTTGKNLLKAKTASGITALAWAITAGEIPPKTTLEDLRQAIPKGQPSRFGIVDEQGGLWILKKYVDPNFKRIGVHKNKIPQILENFECNNLEEAKKFAELTRITYPVETAQWLAKQLTKQQ